MNPSRPARRRRCRRGATAARAVHAVGALVIALLAVTASPGTAHAASSRFWGYYQLQGTSWLFAPTGPDDVVPADGSIEGWRYAVAAMDAPRMPRATPSFDDLCASTAPAADHKRIGVVIDYGRPADTENGAAPPAARGACALVPTAATGADVLQAVADVRREKALVCGIDGHPRAGCFEEVAVPSAPARAPDDPVTLAVAAGPAASTGNATDPTTSDPAAGDAPPGRGGFGATLTVGAALLTLVAVVAAIWLTMRRRGSTRP